MASESSPPPSIEQSGSNTKYALVGIALLALAAIGWCALPSADEPTEPVVAAQPDAGPRPSTALVEQELELPELPVDAGLPDAGEARPTKRVVVEQRAWDDCSGDIPRAEAARIVREHEGRIRACYEHELKRNAQLQGNMTLSLRIAPDGHVDGSQMSGTLRDRAVFSCVRSVTSQMRFPPPGGRDCAIIQAPFSFSPQR